MQSQLLNESIRFSVTQTQWNVVVCNNFALQDRAYKGVYTDMTRIRHLTLRVKGTVSIASSPST